MNGALWVSALLMGLAGTPHCLAMCGAACTAATGGGRMGRLWLFHLTRLLSYAAGGAVAAATVGALASAGQAVAAVKPLWSLVHAAALVLGLYLVWKGRQPEWLERLGRTRAADVQSAQPVTVHRKLATAGGPEAVGGASAPAGPANAAPRGGWRGLATSAAAGLFWVAWPCGLLQSALLVAGLANGALQGAIVMLAFGLGSAFGLWVGPVVWARWIARRGQGAAGSVPGRAHPAAATWAVRLAGLALAGGSFWAMSHGVWSQVAAYCFS